MILWAAGLIVGILLGLGTARQGRSYPLPPFRLVGLIVLVAVLTPVQALLPAGMSRYVFWSQQLLALVPLLFNLHIPAVALIAVGFALNGLAILSGGGRMPILGSQAFLRSLPVTYGPFTGGALNWLGDWIYIRAPFVPPPNHIVASPGDLIITLAVAGLAWQIGAWARTEMKLERKEEAL